MKIIKIIDELCDSLNFVAKVQDDFLKKCAGVFSKLFEQSNVPGSIPITLVELKDNNCKKCYLFTKFIGVSYKDIETIMLTFCDIKEKEYYIFISKEEVEKICSDTLSNHLNFNYSAFIDVNNYTSVLYPGEANMFACNLVSKDITKNNTSEKVDTEQKENQKEESQVEKVLNKKSHNQPEETSKDDILAMMNDLASLYQNALFAIQIKRTTVDNFVTKFTLSGITKIEPTEDEGKYKLYIDNEVIPYTLDILSDDVSYKTSFNTVKDYMLYRIYKIANDNSYEEFIEIRLK